MSDFYKSEKKIFMFFCESSPHKNFSGKNPSHPQNFACSCTYAENQ